MKKISKILLFIISIINMSNIYAAIETPSSTNQKIGFGIYLGISILILASLATYFHMRITRIKYVDAKDKKVILAFNSKVKIIRWIFMAVVYILFVINMFTTFFTILYCLEGLGKSMTEIVIYSPMSHATEHFIEVILLSGLILMLSKAEHIIIRRKIEKSNEYNEEEKKILIQHYK
ncbi:MAG: hypothetical protein J6A15_01535 [Clostridia bacterium]|nr:hypothetical protein [Clostridia bacterium]